MHAEKLALCPEIHVVKLQLALASSDHSLGLLIYNQSRSILYETAADPELVALFPEDQPKIFLRAVLREDGQLQLHSDLLPDPGW